jgi:hypothetical protein
LRFEDGDSVPEGKCGLAVMVIDVAQQSPNLRSLWLPRVKSLNSADNPFLSSELLPPDMPKSL